MSAVFCRPSHPARPRATLYPRRWRCQASIGLRDGRASARAHAILTGWTHSHRVSDLEDKRSTSLTGVYPVKLHDWTQVANFGDRLHQRLWHRLLPGFFDDDAETLFFSQRHLLNGEAPTARRLRLSLDNRLEQALAHTEAAVGSLKRDAKSRKFLSTV